MSTSSFSEEAAQSGINTMEQGGGMQSQNADNFKSLLGELDGAFSGAISSKFKEQAEEHATNLKTEAENTRSLASSSNKSKNIFARLTQNIEQPK